MQCIKCNHKNPGSVLYCQKCGNKMDMTADEIQLFYEQKVRSERREAMRTYAVRSLILSGVFFIIALTVLVMAGGEPPATSYIPSAVKDTEFLRYQYRVVPKLEPMLIPISEDRK